MQLKKLKNQEKVIHKIHLNSRGRLTKVIPKDSRFLSAGVQGHEELVVWILTSPDAETMEHDFFVAATGELLPDEKMGYLATVQTALGLVWHIWEIEDTKVWEEIFERANELLPGTAGL